MKIRTITATLSFILTCVLVFTNVSYAKDSDDTETLLKEANVRIMSMEAQTAYLKNNQKEAVALAVDALEQAKKDGVKKTALAESVIVNATGLYLPYETWEKYAVDANGGYRLLFSGSGKYLCATGYDNVLQIIDTKTCKVIETLTDVNISEFPGAFQVDKETVFYLKNEGGMLVSYDLEAKTENWIYSESEVRDFWCSEEGNTLVISGKDGIAVLDKSSGKVSYQIKQDDLTYIGAGEDGTIRFYRNKEGGVDVFSYKGSDKETKVSITLEKDCSCILASVQGENIYICADSKEEDDLFLCVSIKDGKEKWRTICDFDYAYPQMIRMYGDGGNSTTNTEAFVLLLGTVPSPGYAPSVLFTYNSLTGKHRGDFIIDNGGFAILASEEQQAIRILGSDGIRTGWPMYPNLGFEVKFDASMYSAASFDETMLASYSWETGVAIWKKGSNADYTEIKDKEIPEEMEKDGSYDNKNSDVSEVSASLSGDGKTVTIENKKTKETTSVNIPDEVGETAIITLSGDGAYLLVAGMPQGTGNCVRIYRFSVSSGEMTDSLDLEDYLENTGCPIFISAGDKKVFLVCFHGAYLISFDDKLREYTCFLYEEGNGFGGLYYNYLCYRNEDQCFYMRGSHSWDTGSPVKKVKMLDTDGVLKAGKAYLEKHGGNPSS